MIRHLLILPFACFVLFVSCKKDGKPNDSIEFGSDQDVKVTAFDEAKPVIGEYNKSAATFELDVNRDARMDIQIRSGVSGSPGGGTSSGTWIKPLHDNVAIAAVEVPDTIFAGDLYSTKTFDGITEVFLGSRTSNAYFAGGEVKSVSTSRETRYFQEGDALFANDEFFNESLVVSSSSSRRYGSSQSSNAANDTITYESDNTFFSHGVWPVGSEGYIGFNYNGRLGWIKVELQNENALLVQEVAIGDIHPF